MLLGSLVVKVFRFAATLFSGAVIGIALTLYYLGVYRQDIDIKTVLRSVVETRIAARRSAANADVRLLDFGATWCAPCKEQDPIIEELRRRYGDSIAVTKIDIDADPETTQRYEIRGVPTIIIEKKGVVVQRFTGLQDGNTIATALDEALR